jgi:hypothetical protein
VVFSVPMKLRRRGGRKQIIAPDGSDSTTSEGNRRNESLAVTIARAHRWQQLLESGRYATIGELARDAGVDNSYLARMLRLTLLAPDIIESILKGIEPDGLSLEKLYGLPVGWGEQREILAGATSDPQARQTGRSNSRARSGQLATHAASGGQSARSPRTSAGPPR